MKSRYGLAARSPQLWRNARVVACHIHEASFSQTTHLTFHSSPQSGDVVHEKHIARDSGTNKPFASSAKWLLTPTHKTTSMPSPPSSASPPHHYSAHETPTKHPRPQTAPRRSDPYNSFSRAHTSKSPRKRGYPRGRRWRSSSENDERVSVRSLGGKAECPLGREGKGSR